MGWLNKLDKRNIFIFETAKRAAKIIEDLVL
jgi:hypothetical protein